MKLGGKVILITGGASPIGGAIALRLAQLECRLAVTYYKGKARAETLKKELETKHAEVELFPADLADSESLRRLIDRVEKRFQRLDALINNASVFPVTPLSETGIADWQQVVDINARAPFFLIQLAAPLLRKSKGSVINISDVYGQQPILKNRVPYSVSKATLDAITKAYAYAVAPEIRVNAVAPGAITFPQDYTEEQREMIRKKIPLGREGTPENIADAVVYLLAEAEYVTGQILSVDGGRFI